MVLQFSNTTDILQGVTKLRIRVIFATAILLAGLGLWAENAFTVFVSVPPQVEAARRIGGPAVQVEVLVPPGLSPESYQLNIRAYTALRAAKALFLIGMPLEQPLRERIAARQPGLLLVDTREGMTFRDMDGQKCGGADHPHAAGADPHVWLDVENMIVHARHLQRTFTALQPEQAEKYRQRAESYIQELQALQQELQTSLAPYAGRQVLVVHPAFGYFLSRYGLLQLAVEQDGKEPGVRQLQELLQTARSINAKAIFTQPQISAQTAGSLARHLGLEVAELDPLPQEYCAGMRAIASQLQRYLSP